MFAFTRLQSISDRLGLPFGDFSPLQMYASLSHLLLEHFEALLLSVDAADFEQGLRRRQSGLRGLGELGGLR